MVNDPADLDARFTGLRQAATAYPDADPDVVMHAADVFATYILTGHIHVGTTTCGCEPRR